MLADPPADQRDYLLTSGFPPLPTALERVWRSPEYARRTGLPFMSLYLRPNARPIQMARPCQATTVCTGDRRFARVSTIGVAARCAGNLDHAGYVPKL